MKKTLSLIMAALFVMSCLNVVVFADEAHASATIESKAEVIIGEEFDVYVSLENYADIRSLALVIGYDSEVVEQTTNMAEALTVTSGVLMSDYDGESAVYASKDTLDAGITAADGKVLKLSFKAIAEGNANITCEVTEEQVSGEKVTYSAEGGAVVVKSEPHAEVAVVGETADINIGDEIDVYVTMANYANIRSVALVIGYDTTVLEQTTNTAEALTVTSGVLMSDYDGESAVYASTGTLDAGITAADGKVLKLSFKAIAKGTAAITCEVTEAKASGAKAAYEATSFEVRVGCLHEKYTSEVTVPASCDTAGVTTYSCVACDYSYTKDEPAALGHTWGEKTVTVEPTCTTDGKQAEICTVCGDLGEEEVVPATGHDWDEGTVTKAATCAAEGEKTYTCLNECGETKTEAIAMIDHTYGEDADVVEATCTKDGSKTFNCTGCDNKITEVIPATGHDWDEGTVTKEATCAAEGEKTYTCLNECGETKTEAIAKTSHTWGEVTVKVEPTCTTDGEQSANCEVCDAESEAEAVPALGHDWNEATVTVEPTCTTDGEKAAICEVCGEVGVAIVIPALGHTWENWEVVVEATEETVGLQRRICGICGKVEEYEIQKADDKYIWKENSELEEGTLELTIDSVNVGTFTFEEEEETEDNWTIQAEDGQYAAVVDGEFAYTDEPFGWTYDSGTFQTTVISQSPSTTYAVRRNAPETITYYLVADGEELGISTSTSEAATEFFVQHIDEHIYNRSAIVEPDCSNGGYTVYACIYCDSTYTDEFDALGHNYTSVTKLPSCTENGYTENICGLCGDTYYSDETDALGHSYADGVCSECGEPEEDECRWTENVFLADGTFEMSIGYANVGEFTFAAAEGGWTIQAEDGRYAAIVDNKFAYTDAPFVWTYAFGRFQKTVTLQSSSSNNKWGGNWGSWFDKYYGNSFRSITYYLVADGDDLGISTFAIRAAVKLYIIHTGEHNWSEPVSADRFHIVTCTICNSEQSEFCDDETCELCSQIVSVNVSVEVTSTSGSSNSGWRDQFFGSSRKTYTAKIQAEAQGAEIEGVFYSTNGRTWKSGTSFTSSRNITSFQIRIDLSNAESYYFQYRNGTVSAK